MGVLPPRTLLKGERWTKRKQVAKVANLGPPSKRATRKRRTARRRGIKMYPGGIIGALVFLIVLIILLKLLGLL